MRKLGVGFVVVVGLVLSGCAAAEPEDLFTLEQAKSVILTTSEDLEPLDAIMDSNEPTETTASALFAKSMEQETVDPAECLDAAFVGVRSDDDEGSTDPVVTYSLLYFNDDSVASQLLRLFPNVDEAKAFESASRDVLKRCPEIRVASDNGPVTLTYTVEDLPTGGAGFAVKLTRSVSGAEEEEGWTYVMRQGNLIVFLLDYFSGNEAQIRAAQEALAEKLDARFEATVNDDGESVQTLTQTAAEACAEFADIANHLRTEAYAEAVSSFDGDSSALDQSIAEWRSVHDTIINTEAKVASADVLEHLEAISELRYIENNTAEERDQAVYDASESVMAFGELDAGCSQYFGGGLPNPFG